MHELIHNHAAALAAVLLEFVVPCLREEEHGDAREVFYEASKLALSHFAESIGQTQYQVDPSVN